MHYITPYKLPFSCQESRGKLFVDYVKLGGCAERLILHYEASLKESQSTSIKWGFRPAKWLEDRHGSSKAKKLMDRKIQLGLFPSCTLCFPSHAVFYPGLNAQHIATGQRAT